MICILALLVFGILGIFSAAYRQIFFEACDCIFRRVTFRKCRTGLDNKLKSQITGSIMRFSPFAARITYKYFEVFSWAFLILLIVSMYFTGAAIYNFTVYGNCNGPGSTEFCIFDPFASTNSAESLPSCTEHPKAAGELIYPNSTVGMKSFGNPDAKVKVIEFGCYSCPFTKKAQPAINEMLAEFGDQIEFVYIDFPLPTHEASFEAALAANCINNQSPELYHKYVDKLFSDIFSLENLSQFAQEISADTEEFKLCMDNKYFEGFVEQNIAIGHDVGVYGTPTFFINKTPLVGPQSYKTLKKLIKKELNKVS